MSFITLYLKNKYPEAVVTQENGYIYVGKEKYVVVTSETLVDGQFFRNIDCCKLLLVAADSTILDYSLSDLPELND